MSLNIAKYLDYLAEHGVIYYGLRNRRTRTRYLRANIHTLQITQQQYNVVRLLCDLAGWDVSSYSPDDRHVAMFRK